MTDIEKACDDALIATLSPALRTAIDRLVARGVARPAILAYAVASAARAGGGRHSTVVMAVEAYLASKR